MLFIVKMSVCDESVTFTFIFLTPCRTNRQLVIFMPGLALLVQGSSSGAQRQQGVKLMPRCHGGGGEKKRNKGSKLNVNLAVRLDHWEFTFEMLLIRLSELQSQEPQEATNQLPFK